MSLLDFFLETIGPTRCFGCNKFGLYFCSRCLTTVQLVDEQKCPVCGKPAVGGATHPRCKKRYAPDGLFSLFKYQGLVRTAIAQLKYRRLTDVKNELSRLTGCVLKKFYEEDLLFEMEDFIFYENPVLVPIALHWLRKTERKFNQAKFMADIFANEYERPVLADLLVRTKNTKQQVKLKRKEREKNVQRVFRVRDKYLTDRSWRSGKAHKRIDANIKNILLIDDVVTTGATLRSAANALKRSGAERVWALTLAAR